MASEYKRVADVSLQQVDNNEILWQFCQQACIKRYKPKTIIFNKDDIANTIYLLISGSLTVFVKDHHNNHELVLNHISRVSFFGEMAYYIDSPRRSTSITTRTECLIAEMPYYQYEQFTAEYPKIANYMCKHISKRLKKSSDNTSSMIFDDVLDRTQDKLFELAELPEAAKLNSGILLRVTRQEIANLIGVSRETIGRCIKVLEQYEIVHSHGKNIILLYPQVVRDRLSSNKSLEIQFINDNLEQKRSKFENNDSLYKLCQGSKSSRKLKRAHNTNLVNVNNLL